MIKIRISILFIALVFVLSSNNASACSLRKNNRVQNFDSCVLFIYSPYDCYYKITLSKSGIGDLKTFVKKDLAQSECSNDSIISKYFFKVMVASDMQKITKIIDQIEASDSVRTSRMFDTYGFALVVDKKKYINVYGQNEKVDRLLKALFKYVKKADDRCGFFKLFKKTV